MADLWGVINMRNSRIRNYWVRSILKSGMQNKYNGHCQSLRSRELLIYMQNAEKRNTELHRTDPNTVQKSFLLSIITFCFLFWVHSISPTVLLLCYKTFIDGNVPHIVTSFKTTPLFCPFWNPSHCCSLHAACSAFTCVCSMHTCYCGQLLSSLPQNAFPLA